MRIDVEKRGPVCVFRITGQMVIGPSTEVLRNRFREELAAGERQFVFDMTGVPWLDSGSIGETVACHKRAMDKDGIIRLALKDRAHDLYTFYMLDKVFPLYQDTDSAVADFGAQAAGQ